MRHGRPVRGVATDHGGCGRWPLRHQPGGRGPACRETANRVGRIQHRDYGWPGGFARLRSRRPGGELGDFTARTKAMTRRVGSPRLQKHERGDEYEQRDQNGERARRDPRHPGHSGRHHHHTTSSAKFLSHGSSSALVIGTVVRGTPVPLYALSCWQVIRGRAAGEGTR